MRCRPSLVRGRAAQVNPGGFTTPARRPSVPHRTAGCGKSSLRPLMAGSSPSLPDGSNPSAAIVQSASDVQCSRLLKTTRRLDPARYQRVSGGTNLFKSHAFSCHIISNRIDIHIIPNTIRYDKSIFTAYEKSPRRSQAGVIRRACTSMSNLHEAMTGYWPGAPSPP